MSFTSTFADFMGMLHSVGWVDLISLVLLIVCVVIGKSRGLSGLLSTILGLSLAFLGGKLLHVPLNALISRYDSGHEHIWLCFILPYIVGVLSVLVLFILLRLLLKRFIKLVIEQPIDWIFGALAGLLLGLLVLLLLFSGAELLPEQNRIRTTLCENSRFGKHVVPSLRTAWQHLTQTMPATERKRGA